MFVQLNSFKLYSSLSHDRYLVCVYFSCAIYIFLKISLCGTTYAELKKKNKKKNSQCASAYIFGWFSGGLRDGSSEGGCKLCDPRQKFVYDLPSLPEEGGSLLADDNRCRRREFAID